MKKSFSGGEEVARFLGAAVRDALAGESAMTQERVADFVAALDYLEAMSPRQRASAFIHVGAVAIAALCPQARAANQAHKAIFQHNSRENMR